MTQLQRFKSALAERNFDGAIISSEINQRYLCDFPFSDGYILVTQGKSYVLTDFRYIEAAKRAIVGFEILCPESSMADTIAELLKSENASRIAVEESTVSLQEYNRFSRALDGIASLSEGASDILLSQRAVKLDYEIERIKTAQSITDAAFSYIVGFISQNKSSLTERDIALELDYFMQKNGAECPAFETIAVSGDASSLPHGVPRGERLKSGFLTMDFGAKYNGYCSDMTRSFVVGTAPEGYVDVYHAVLEAQETAIKNLKAGIKGKDGDAIARNVLKEKGYGEYFTHSLGHSLGVDVHESPGLTPRCEEIIPEGSVLSVEPGVYIEGKYGVRIEDIVLFQKSGVDNLTNSNKNLIILK